MNVYTRTSSPHRLNMGQPKRLSDGVIYSPAVSASADGMIRIAIGAEGRSLFIEMSKTEAENLARNLGIELERLAKYRAGG